MPLRFALLCSTAFLVSSGFGCEDVPGSLGEHFVTFSDATGLNKEMF